MTKHAEQKDKECDRVMRMGHKIKSAVCCLMAAALAGAWLPAARAAEPERQVVRVAFPEQEGMSYISREDKVSGYNYDYLEKISEYTGWEMEYIAYSSADGNEAVGSALRDLQEGRVDLLGPLLKNEQTEALFEFPEHSYGTVYTTLCAPVSSSLRESGIRGVWHLRVGLWEQAKTRNAEVLNFLESENITGEIVYYDSAEEQEQALMDGEVDVISGLSLSPVSNTCIVAKFAARPYYFAATKGSTDLIRELDRTMEELNENQPHLTDALFERYFLNTDDEFTVSGEQRQTLAAQGALRVLCVDGDAPYVYSDDNGEAKGAIVSVLNDFAGKMELPIEYTFCGSRDEADALLAAGEYDILAGIPLPSDYCAQAGFIKSETIMRSGIAFAKRQSAEGRGGVLALVRGTEESVNTADFDSVLLCDTNEDSIAAVRRGQADAAAGDRSVLEYYIYDTHSAITTSLILGEQHNVCVAVARDRREPLLSVLNSYIYSLSDMKKTMYLEDGNAHSHAESLSHYIALHPTESTAAGILLTLLVTAVVYVLIYSVKMNRKNRELRAANEAKSEFLSRMSHDIRTPMNAIVGMVNVAEGHADDPAAVRGYLDKIRTASAYLLSLINDILDMRKVESEQIELHEDTVDLHGLVCECACILENRASEQNVELDISGMDGFAPPRVAASAQHLQRVFMNVIGNAIKYNKPGGAVCLAARVRAQSAETVDCEFVVADTGIGISEEFQKRMFQPFTQENTDSRGEYRGTGLGLAIVKAIVDKMGGTITVKSAPGSGTTMTIRLAFPIDRSSGPAEVVRRPSGAYLAGRTILAAEDNALNAEILQLLLEQAGARVTMTENGEQLAQRFADAAPGTYDLILTDIMMPVMDGYEAARRIRAMERPDAQTIPIVALTANAFAEDAKRAEDAGMNAHLPKPVDTAKLAETLERLLAPEKQE